MSRILSISAALLAVLLLEAPSYGQYRELYTLDEEVDLICFDNLLNLYKVKNTELVKYDKNGEFKFRYSDKRLGNIGSVDVTFPLRPLLVYPDINYAVLLDNTLSNNRGNINLLNQGIDLGMLACASVQNHFWFYDAMNFSLVRTNENFKHVTNTGNLAQVLRIQSLQPNFLKEFANRVYLNNPSTGILVFDIFGTYIKTIPIIGLTEFQVNGNELVYFKEGSLFRFNSDNYEETEIPLPEGTLQALLQKNRIALRMSQLIAVLELN
ncbi:MAG: hypothetical protein LC670_02680 [Flavobacteriales bacterium]|nr:hypothetical protein [Flavobacteriales bacterium]